ncbi:hypothetical protein HMPREF1199_01897 [Hoylesella oralis CC98A]|nr:hypothetical protein HMPREF1199_01897 [Hoylesella oralis CC98A]
MAQQALDKPNPYNTPINHSSLLLNPSTTHPSFGGAGGGPHFSLLLSPSTLPPSFGGDGGGPHSSLIPNPSPQNLYLIQLLQRVFAQCFELRRRHTCNAFKLVR